MARFMSLTYGVLPTREQFDTAFYRYITEPHRSSRSHFRFGNDKRVGTCEMTCPELWREVCKATAEFNKGACVFNANDQDNAGDWASSVLECLGIEWI